MVKKNKQNLSRVENSLMDGGYSGEPFAEAIKELLGATVEVVKRSELHKFAVIPKRWVVEIDSATVDRGYKGHGVESDPLRNHTKIFISGQRRGLTKSLKKQLKRRSAIEPMIGHMKQEGKLGLCRLKGIVGNQLNALLTGVGHNLRLILNHIRKLLKLGKLKNFLIQILFQLLEIFLLKIYRVRSC